LALHSKLIVALIVEAKGLGNDDFSLIGVPRTGWVDIVDNHVTSLGNNRLELEPYPIDVPEFEVSVPAKVLPAGTNFEQALHFWWHQVPKHLLAWTFVAF
jgi:hypothetical protein